MLHKFRLFSISLFYCLLCYSSLASDHTFSAYDEAAVNEWSPLGLLDDNGRATRLMEIFDVKFKRHGNEVFNSFLSGKASVKEAAETYLTPEIHGSDLSSYGRSFSYDGRPDDLFCNYLKENKGDKITVFVPAFGIGRTVLDVLSINQNAKVIANDLVTQQQGVLEELIKKYRLDAEQVSFLMGDILEVIKTLEPESIDAAYVANLLHFLSPFKIRELFVELNRVLKPNGQLFLVWRGFSESFSVRATSLMYQMEKHSKILSSWNLPFPRYVEKDDFEPVAGLEYPYFAATVSDIKNLSDGIFKSVEGGEQNTINKTYGYHRIPHLPLLNLGAYKAEALQASSEMDIVINYLILQKSSDILEVAGTLEQDPVTFGTTRRLAIEKIPTCDHCKKLLKKPLMQCSVCKSVSYCNKDCQRAHWRTHKPLCKAERK